MSDQSVQGGPPEPGKAGGDGPDPAGGSASGSPPASTLLVIGLALYLFAVTAGALWLLLFHSPIPELLGGTGTAPVSGSPTDWEVLHLVVAMGALGSVIHAATSLADYVGNRGLVRSWALWFVMRPLTGVLLAVIFFFLLRLGVIQPNGAAGSLNPVAVGAFSGLVGMFSKQAIDKLAEVFDTFFQGRHDGERKDKLPKTGAQAGAATTPASIASATPATLAVGQQNAVLTLTGQGFGTTPQAAVNGKTRTSNLNGDGSLKVTLAAEDVATAGSLQVTVLPAGNAALASPPFPVTVQ